MAKAKNKKRPIAAVKNKWQQLREKYNDTPNHSFRLTPRRKHKYSLKGVVESWELLKESFYFIKQHAKFFAGLGVIYCVFSYILVGGVSQIDYVALRQSSEEFLAGGVDRVTTAVSYFGAALTGGLNEAPNEVQQLAAAVLALLCWLIIIWSTRMLSAGKTIKIRDALYNGPTPFISTILVLTVTAVQLIPAALGLFVFSIAITDQWISTGVEGMAFGAAAALLCLLSLYWLTGSLIALTVVALPGVYPMQALATARALVSGKRWGIALRILAVAIVQVLVAAVVLLPIFMLDGWLKFDWLPLVPIFIQIMSAIALIFSGVYVYKLYRSLL